MKYNLAVDSGGTKVLAILYGEDFRPLRSCRVGSTRANTTSQGLIDRNIAQLIETLELPGKTIGCLHGAMDSVLITQIQKVSNVECVSGHSELAMALAAAGIFENGCMALSGTGNNVSVLYQGKVLGFGGYGAAVSDEGSGYWLAREAFNAAIWDDELRGPRTLLTDLIAGHFGYPREDLRKGIFSIYSQDAMSPVAFVASCAPLVSKAADAGDPVALDILARTGRSTGQQVTGLFRKYALPRNLPITLSGSVWRGHPTIFESFYNVLESDGLGQNVILPEFEPIIGTILIHYRKTHPNCSPDELKQFQTIYSQYRYDIGSTFNRRNQIWNSCTVTAKP